MRRLLQFAMVFALLFGGDAFAATTMPCCAPSVAAGTHAEMQMPPAESAPQSCHGADVVAMPSQASMSMQATPMIRCPRSSANVQASNEWKSNEQAESHSPLQAFEYVSWNSLALPPHASRVSAVALLRTLFPSDLSNSLPLRI